MREQAKTICDLLSARHLLSLEDYEVAIGLVMCELEKIHAAGYRAGQKRMQQRWMERIKSPVHWTGMYFEFGIEDLPQEKRDGWCEMGHAKGQRGCALCEKLP